MGELERIPLRQQRGRGEAGRHVVVLGAGVVGLSVARELRARGLAVTVADRRRSGGGASTKSVGVLSAPTARQSAFARLCRLGYEGYADLASSLRQETGTDIGFRECGCLHLSERATEDAKLRAAEARWQAADVGVRIAGREVIEADVPGYGGRFRAGLTLEREAVLDPERLVEALRLSCKLRGVRIVEEAGDLELVERAPGRVGVNGWRKGRPEGIEEGGSGETVVVLAAGCWSGLAARHLSPAALPVEPIRGQALELRHPPPRRVVHFQASFDAKGYYLVPRGEDRVWVGSTVEEAGFDEGISDAAKEELLRAAAEVLPQVSGDHVVRQWDGLRPKATRRGGPLLSLWPGTANLWVACGHYRSGILTGPASARLVAGAMVQAERLPPEFEF